MTYKMIVNTLSFTRLSFAPEDMPLSVERTDEASKESVASNFRNFMDARHSIGLSEHKGLQAQVLLSQIVRDSDERKSQIQERMTKCPVYVGIVA